MAESEPAASEERAEREARRRRRSTAIMAGSAAPKSAGWMFPKPGEYSLVGAWRGNPVAMMLTFLPIAAIVAAVVLGSPRTAAYIAVGGLLLAAAALYRRRQ